MARLPKQTPLIPLAPIKYSGSLSKKEQNCVAWHVLSNCPQVEALTLFLHPELVTSPATAQRLSREFFGSKEAIDFITRYVTTIKEATSAPEAATMPETAPVKPKPRPEPTPKMSGESDAEYKKRRKREAAESIVEKIIERVDEVEDIDGLLDTIKAMKDTKFFDDESVAQMPPIRYLPETCSSCEYKKFIDEQIRLGEIVRK